MIMLEVDMKTTIRTLYKKGYNKTQIGRMLGIDRKTVRKVLKENEEYQDSSNHPPEQKTGIWPSMLDDYREFIEIQLAKELSITRIHQDLQKEFGVECGYTTLRDYIAKIRKSQPHAYMVLHSLPGEEAQVDFGYIGTIKSKRCSQKSLDICHVIKLFPIYVCIHYLRSKRKNLYPMPYRSVPILRGSSPDCKD